MTLMLCMTFITKTIIEAAYDKTIGDDIAFDNDDN